MVSRATMAAAAAALLLAGGGDAAPQVATGSRVLWAGPVLAGDAVVWEEAAGSSGSLHAWTQRDGERVIYRSGLLALGRPLAASQTLLAFERAYPSCPASPSLVCPQATDALVGPLGGPYRTLVRPRMCFLPVGNAVALDVGDAAYLEVDCAAERLRVLVRDVARNGVPRLVREAAISSGCCRDLAVAGRYLAWIDRPGILVYDTLARRVAYRARITPDGIDVEAGFDLQRDGKLAVAYRLGERARAGPTTIAWRSSAEPRLHVLRLRARDTRIRIAANQIAFERYLSSRTSALTLVDLAGGRARTVVRFAPPTRLGSRFDFDGRRIVWASDRVTATRTDCPGPLEGRPCIVVESGITTIWRQDLPTGKRRVLARLRFVDSPTRP